MSITSRKVRGPRTRVVGRRRADDIARRWDRQWKRSAQWRLRGGAGFLDHGRRRMNFGRGRDVISPDYKTSTSTHFIVLTMLN
jgi:hypothetical protein